ncbi:MAG: hypothetical protein ACP5QA_13380, partial [Phycisphaerae bacterium]
TPPSGTSPALPGTWQSVTIAAWKCGGKSGHAAIIRVRFTVSVPEFVPRVLEICDFSRLLGLGPIEQGNFEQGNRGAHKDESLEWLSPKRKAPPAAT